MILDILKMLTFHDIFELWEQHVKNNNSLMHMDVIMQFNWSRKMLLRLAILSAGFGFFGFHIVPKAQKHER